MHEFWDEVDAVTTLIFEEDYDLPEDCAIPLCHCGLPCALRRYPDGDELYEMWTCVQHEVYDLAVL